MIPVITHEDLARLACKAGEILGNGPGLGGRVEPGCLATEMHRMAEMYLRLSGYVPRSDENQAAIMEAVETACRTGMAIGFARAEELLEERGVQ